MREGTFFLHFFNPFQSEEVYGSSLTLYKKCMFLLRHEDQGLPLAAYALHRLREGNFSQQYSLA